MNLLRNLKERGLRNPTGHPPAPDTQEQVPLVAVQGNSDRDFMLAAIGLAEKGLETAHPNPVVGCVIVNNGKVIGQGWHRFAGEPHAEVHALKRAGTDARGATLYVTLEPCSHKGRTPPCVKSILKAGISRVVIAVADPNPLVNGAGISALERNGIAVELGVCRRRAREINKGYFKRLTRGRPWVTLKTATSLDGKTAMKDGESRWISGPDARQDAHRLRAQSSCILTGVGTVLRDDPLLTARLEGIKRQPAVAIVDTRLSTPGTAKILQRGGETIIFTRESDAARDAFADDKVDIVQSRQTGGKIDLGHVLEVLAARQVNNVLLEAGPVLCGSMIEQALVDEMVVYMSPDLMGNKTRDMFSLPQIQLLSEKIRFEYVSVEQMGRDLKLVLAAR